MSNNDKEMINHPDHYGGKDNIYEAIKVVRAWLGDEGCRSFCLGNALKYISRADKKDPSKRNEDIKKASWYICYVVENLGDRNG